MISSWITPGSNAVYIYGLCRNFLSNVPQKIAMNFLLFKHYILRNLNWKNRCVNRNGMMREWGSGKFRDAKERFMYWNGLKQHMSKINHVTSLISIFCWSSRHVCWLKITARFCEFWGLNWKNLTSLFAEIVLVWKSVIFDESRTRIFFSFIVGHVIQRGFPCSVTSRSFLFAVGKTVLSRELFHKCSEKKERKKKKEKEKN